MKHLKTYSELNEAKIELNSKKEFEVSYHFDDEKEARKDLKSQGFRFKGYIVPEGYDHIWIEQWTKQGEGTPIARLIWLDNIQLKSKPEQTLPTIMNGAQVTILSPEHPKYSEAKEMKFGSDSKSYPEK